MIIYKSLKHTAIYHSIGISTICSKALLVTTHPSIVDAACEIGERWINDKQGAYNATPRSYEDVICLFTITMSPPPGPITTFQLVALQRLYKYLPHFTVEKCNIESAVFHKTPKEAKLQKRNNIVK